jgi:DNA-binding beta-propeller fold protein YncE
MRFAWVILTLAALFGTGCAKPAGVIFPPLQTPLVWPEAPDEPRIRYVGQLATSADLKPGRSAFAGFGQAVFGKRESYSMLSPYALCTDGGDRLFVADNGAQVVHVFDMKTRRYARWSPDRGKDGKVRRNQPGFTQPVGVAWDPAGRLLVSDSIAGLIYIFDAQGTPLGHIGQGIVSRPAGIAVDRSRRIFVADVMGHQVVVLSPEGRLLQRIGTRGDRLGEFNYPTNVALDGTGRLYVSDSLNFRVQQFSPDLKPVRQIGEQGDVPGTFAQPKGVAVDRAGHLYAVDSRFENVQIFDDRGRLLLFFGEEGSRAGQFWLPAGIFIDPRNRIWIADAYNRRVAVFDYLHVAEETEPATQPEGPATRQAEATP